MTKGYIIQLFNGRVGNRSNYFSWGTGKDQSVILPKPMAESNRTLWSFPIQMYQGKTFFSPSIVKVSRHLSMNHGWGFIDQFKFLSQPLYFNEKLLKQLD